MPAWTPASEAFAPYDEDGELREDIPQDLAAFLQRFEVSKNFTIELKKWTNEGYQGRPNIAATYEGTVPTYEGIVCLHGPGYFGLDTTWTPKGGKVRNEIFKVPLIGPHWEEMYKEAKKKRHKEQLERAKEDAQLERAEAGMIPGGNGYVNPNQAGREYMQGVVGDIKGLFDGLGINFGGLAKNGNGGGGDMNMGMMFLGMMNMMMKSNENSMNLMITMMNNQNKGNSVTETVGLLREVLSVRDGLMPRDKSWIEEVVGALSDNIGPIVGMFARGASPDEPLAQKLNEGLAPTRERAQNDPAFLRGLVKHMDTKLGAKLTDQVLEGFLNVNREPPKAGKPSPAPSGPAKHSDAPAAPATAPAGAEAA
jgi:hypothetical protein